MDFTLGIGSVYCRLCGASYQKPIRHLNEPIDIFSEWFDDCEAGSTIVRPPVPRPVVTKTTTMPTDSGLGQRNVAPKNDTNSRSIDLGVGDSEDDDDNE
jgi:Transcription elongation factor Elf1 like